MRHHTPTLVGILLFTIFAITTFPSPSATLIQNKESVYVPKDLEDCFVQLEKILTKDEMEKIRSGPESNMGQYFLELGAWMRNNWGLWANSGLAEWFNSVGVRHPDDISGIILNSFWRRLNGKPIRLDEQVRLPYYRVLEINRVNKGEAGQKAFVVINLTDYVSVETLKQVTCNVICKENLGNYQAIGIEMHRGLERMYLPVDPQVIQTCIGAYILSLDRPGVLLVERDEKGQQIKDNLLHLPFNHRTECSCGPED